MKNNYPIRYVALPLSEKGVWRSDSDNVHGVICYLVIKCYVVGEETLYDREGNSFTKYKVVPTYGAVLPHLFESKEPRYNIDDFDYNKKIEFTNYLYTENIFEKLEDAEKYRDERNKDIAEIVVSAAPKWANLKEKFEDTVKKYKSVESFFASNTEHLPTDDSKRRNHNIIFSVDDNYGLLDEEMSVYSLIDEGAYADDSYAVYTISKEEAKELEKVLEDDDNADAFTLDSAKKYMHTPLMMHIGSYDYAKLISPKNESIIISMCDEPFVSRVPSSIRKLKIDEGEFRELFFTLETYDDIVESYNLEQKRKKSINLKLKPEDIWTNDRYKY